MSGDLNEFIQAQRHKLERERSEYTSNTNAVDGERQRRHDVHTTTTTRMRGETDVLPAPVYAENGPDKEFTGTTGLSLNDYEKKQKELREERAREYQTFLQHQNEGRHQVEDIKMTGTTLQLQDRTAERERLRSERQAEYRAFLQQKQKGGRRLADRQSQMSGRDSLGTSRRPEGSDKEEVMSVRDVRDKLSILRQAEEREVPVRESHERWRHNDRREECRGGKSRDYDNYDDILERRRLEERRYRSKLYDEDRKFGDKRGDRRRWNESDMMNRWREDDELDQWAREFSRHGHRPVSHENTRSPCPHSPHHYTSSGDSLKSRTHSAPSSRLESNVHSIASLGDDTSREVMRQRKQAYAEELRQQMAEKRGERTYRERHKEHKDDRKPVPILKSSRRSDDDFDPHEEREERHQRHRRLKLTNEQPYRDEYDFNHDFDERHRDRPKVRDRDREDKDWLDDWRLPEDYYSNHINNRGGRVHFQDDSHYSRDSQWRVRDANDYYGISLESNVPQRHYERQRRGEETHGTERRTETDTRSPESATHRQEKRAMDKDEYRRQLDEQMRQKQNEKAREKKQRQEFDRRKDEEIAIYDPWGKAGAGAPMKDRRGRVITDLRSMRASNERRLDNPSEAAASQVVSTRMQPSVSLSGEVMSYGGPGIHSLADTQGAGITGLLSSRYSETGQQEREAQSRGDGKALTAQEEYREYLRKQVEEKAAERAREAEIRRLEEEREAARIEQDRIKMKEEYEAELEKQKRKEEEAKRQNQELMAQQEARRKQVGTQQKSGSDGKQHVVDVERQPASERVPAVGRLSASPPVPTLANKMDVSHTHSIPMIITTDDFVRKSPPVPALWNRSSTEEQQQHLSGQSLPAQHRQPIRTEPERLGNSGVGESVLDSLTVMRRKLQNEQQRLREQRQREKEAHTSLQEEVERGRQAQRQTEVKRLSRDPNEIFDIARSKGKKAALVHYSAQKPHPLSDPPMSQELHDPQAVIGEVQSSVKAAADFNRLKYQMASESRQQFWEKFPEPPTSGGHLDLQQQALIRQQRDELDALHLKADPSYSTHTANRPVSEKSIRSLQADSTFLAIDERQQPLHQQATADSKSRPMSARARRRLRMEQPGGDRQSLSSITSFDVDQVAARNAERLRRLEQITGDKSGLSDFTQPQDVLDRFMRQHGLDGGVRASSTVSEKSLEAETWLRPATGNTTET